MAGLDYSQKRLLSQALHTKKRTSRARRLQLYAVLTGVLSLLISLATLILRILK